MIIYMEVKLKTLTKDEITQAALAELRANGARVRKVHNVPVRRRQYQMEKGIPDICGYSQTGVAIECEVKADGDKLRPEQIIRLNDLNSCGGIALVAIQEGLTVKIIPFKEYFN